MVLLDICLIMSSIKIMDYDVDFPYPQPYEIQKTYMGKVLECLHNKRHGVLESPTGTGKTLCLMAPVSAWIKRQKINNMSNPYLNNSAHLLKDDIPPHLLPSESADMKKWGVKCKNKVWYTSRTHAQITQAVAEVRRCNISGLEVRVMGARDQLCINPDVLIEQESYVKQIKCKELTKLKNCKYYLKLSRERDPAKYFLPGEVLDIEDLVSVGKSCGICPYYLSKSIETADIVLLPYNYIIDKDSREALNLQLKGDAVIFDEGHNVPQTCEESFEFSFTNIDIALGIKNMKEFMSNLAKISEIANDDEEVDIAKHAENSVFMVETLEKLEKGLENFEVTEDLSPVATLYNFFEEAGINYRTSSQLLKSIEEFRNDSIRLSLSGSMMATLHLLEQMLSTIFGSTVKSFDEETINRSFKCGVIIDSERSKRCKQVSLYCFNPSFGIRAILQLGVQSIIITSGTLSPMNTFIYELNLPKPITLQNGHIAKKCQIPFLIVGTGVNNVRMDAAFTNRNDPQYVFSLGMTLTNLISSVPDGVLLLFSSYSMMQNLRDAWESNLGIWKRLNSLKRVFVEPRGKEEFINCLENYKRAIDSGNGAILMGVMRGKISEGMDFKDQYCRSVFIIGVPFPPIKDPRVKGKEKYCESLKIIDPVTKAERKLYHNSFMSVEALRATNQAIGRVIRHGQDYGAILLVDYRFALSRLFQNISAWIRGNNAAEKNFSQSKKVLSEFFRDIHLGKLGVQEVRCQRVDGNGCPVASYVSYEEYEHKRDARPSAPWISAHIPDRKAQSLNVIEYASEPDDDSSPATESSQSNEKPSKPTVKKWKSVFDALEHAEDDALSQHENVNEINKRVLEKFGNHKRKHEDDKETSQNCKTSSGKKSETRRNSNFRKISRIPIKPFSKSDEPEPECIIPEVNFIGQYKECINVNPIPRKPDSPEKETGDQTLKIKLINYFRSVKSTLTEEKEREFKRCSFRYMKGEIDLTDILCYMDKNFETPEEKTLLSGFGICVKSKDREEWEKIRAGKV